MAMAHKEDFFEKYIFVFPPEEIGNKGDQIAVDKSNAMENSKLSHEDKFARRKELLQQFCKQHPSRKKYRTKTFKKSNKKTQKASSPEQTCEHFVLLVPAYLVNASLSIPA